MKTFDELDLDPIMKSRAEELLARCPWVRYTSGRRDLTAQARAMAQNHVADPQTYLTKTYRNGKVFLAAIVDMAPVDQRSVQKVAAAIRGVFQEHPDVLQWKHRDGTCVDIQPLEDAFGEPTEKGQEVIRFIQNCPDTVLFIMREGGLRRWHWECRKAPPSTVEV
jgi:hypothetical protein